MSNKFHLMEKKGLSVGTRRRWGVGVTLGLFVAGVAMCSVMILWPAMGQHLNGCDQISRLINVVALGREEISLVTYVLVAMIAMVVYKGRWLLNGEPVMGGGRLGREEEIAIRSIVDPVMVAIRQGKIINLQYN